MNTVAPQLGARLSGTNFILGWLALSGVSYSVLDSTNLVDWQFLFLVSPGTNIAPIELPPIPAVNPPIQFFRVQATY